MFRALKVALLGVTLALGGCEASVLGSGVLAAAAIALGLKGGSDKETRIGVAPSSLNFGEQVVIQPSVAQSITVSSIGSAPLAVSGVTVGGNDPSSFIVTSECGAPVAPNASCIIRVVFAPKTAGVKSALVSVSSDAKNTIEPVTISGTGALPPAPEIKPTSLQVNVLGIAETRATLPLSATDKFNLPLSFAVTSQGRVGSAAFTEPTANSAKLVFTVPGHLSGNVDVDDPVVISISNGYSSVSETIPVKLRSDPLLRHQWHKQNTGQDAFASTPPVAGNDLRVGPAWASGVSGKGVRVAIIDDGVEVLHEDLRANVDADRSINFISGGKDPTPTNGDSHGTKVAGIIASTAFNTRGGRGVAYGATVRGYNLLAPGASTAANFAIAFGGADTTNDNDIFNASFAGEFLDNGAAFLPSWDPLKGEIITNSLRLRSGRGSPIVQSAGNEFRELRNGFCGPARDYGSSCGNVASDAMRASTNVIVVGATNAAGRRASYSTTGSSIWVSAPGGEFGLSNAFVSVSGVGAEPAIVTTARTGCDKFPFAGAVNALDAKGANALAAQCQYTATMNGTSAAAPNVSAVIALMLEAKPTLTLRDIRHILARTAVRIDPQFSGVRTTQIIPGVNFALDRGWLQNAGGFWFSNWYGFGAVDAGAAVAAARTYTDFLPPQKTPTQHSFAPVADVVIPARSSYEVEFNVAGDMLINEGVGLHVTFDTLFALCNQIEITSPSGMKSIVLQGASGFLNSRLADVRFVSNAFYGEPVNGTWKATYHNLCTDAPTVLRRGDVQTLIMVGR